MQVSIVPAVGTPGRAARLRLYAREGDTQGLGDALQIRELDNVADRDAVASFVRVGNPPLEDVVGAVLNLDLELPGQARARPDGARR
ncbi:MAG: hypothetical protein WD737_08500 [Gemmatimonadota bacterium]